MSPPARFGLALLLAATTSSAQPRPEASAAGLQVVALRESVVASATADGGARLELARDGTAVTEQEQVVTVRFTNTTAESIDNVRVTSAIPADVRYVADSATGPGVVVLFSVDGGLTFGAPSELTVSTAGVAPRPAEVADYTHVRWILDAPLEAGATGFARFRAVRR